MSIIRMGGARNGGKFEDMTQSGRTVLISLGLGSGFLSALHRTPP